MSNVYMHPWSPLVTTGGEFTPPTSGPPRALLLDQTKKVLSPPIPSPSSPRTTKVLGVPPPSAAFTAASSLLPARYRPMFWFGGACAPMPRSYFLSPTVQFSLFVLFIIRWWQSNWVRILCHKHSLKLTRANKEFLQKKLNKELFWTREVSVAIN